ncbi:hypothetical protein C8A05DRAFT_20166, partial [Staphylotrichum tortipilum]
PGGSTPTPHTRPWALDARAATEALVRGIADLTEMAPCHHFAEQALNILKFLAKKWDIDVGFDDADLEELKRATRPVAASLNFFAPNFVEADFTCAWGGPGVRDGIGPGREMEELERNPLFWPFPMQGRPMVLAGRELEEAGFEMI